MTGDLERVQVLFDRAIALPPAERIPFIDRAAGDDPSLHQQLRSLVVAHAAVESAADEGAAFLEALDAPRASALLRAEPERDEPGSAVGRYRIIRRLGSGGMGVVYLARDPTLDRPVALKLLPPYLTGDETAQERLVREARAASALDHPHVATVFEVGRADDDRLFIAMAYYPGETLRQRLAEGPLPIAAAVSIARQVADGLAAAHEKGVVHRDIKPENIAFGPRGVAKILDFGIAMVARPDAEPERGTAGTRAYMSPEQARGGALDHRTDVWSLGVVLHEMLTGRRPADPAAPPAEPEPAMDPALAGIVGRCLAPDPADRFSTAAELRDALAAVEDSAPAAPAASAGSVAASGVPAPGAGAGDVAPAPGAAPAPDAAARGPTSGRAVRALAAGAYLLAAFLAYAGAGPLLERWLLPTWLRGVLLLVLLGGLPVVAAGAFPGWRARLPARLWPRAAAAGVVLVAVLGAVGASVVAGGVPRVTAASGAAGDAFDERGWVVLAEFEATPEAAGVALAAREALAVDFQQSGFVNVASTSQVAGILRQMGVAPSERLDLPLALEVAERAGAGAVLTASVNRLGSQFVLSGRALRPGSGEELFAVRTAAGEERLLGAVERLSREMRRRLGEEREAIRRSRPLPEVTTSSLEALRLYAEADRLVGQDPERAVLLATEAIRVDSTFAMAHRLAGILTSNQLTFGDSHRHLTRAWELRDRLSDRERWHVEVAYHIGVALEPVRAMDATDLLLARYPDDLRAVANRGALLLSWLEDPEGAYHAFRRAAQLDPNHPGLLTHVVHTALVTGRNAVADSLIRVGEALDAGDIVTRWRVGRAIAAGDHKTVQSLCDRLLDGATRPAVAADDGELCGSADVAAGRLRLGVARLEEVERRYLATRRYRNVAHAGQAIAAGDALVGDLDGAAERIVAALESFAADEVPEPDRYITRTNLQVQAALLQRPDLVARVGAEYPPYPEPDHWFGRYGDALVEAAQRVAEGDGDGALAALRAGTPAHGRPIGWRVWDEILRGLAHEALGRPGDAATHYRRATSPGYLALRYLTKDRVYLPHALRRLVEAEAAAGNPAGAAEAHRRLEALWSGADPAVAAELERLRGRLPGAGEPRD